MIANVVSDTFSKSVSTIIKYAMEHPNSHDIDFLDFSRHNMSHKFAEITVSM